MTRLEIGKDDVLEIGLIGDDGKVKGTLQVTRTMIRWRATSGKHWHGPVPVSRLQQLALLDLTPFVAPEPPAVPRPADEPTEPQEAPPTHGQDNARKLADDGPGDETEPELFDPAAAAPGGEGFGG